MKKAIGALLCATALTGCATTYDFKPVADASDTVRYNQGTATTYFDSKDLAAEVTPLGFNDEKQVMFGVAVVNKSTTPITFGYENVSMANATGLPIAIYDRPTLERQARNRAIIAAVAVGVAGAASAAAAANNSYSTTNATLYTPHGAYAYHATTYNPGLAYASTAAISAGTGAEIANISNRLHDTLTNLHGQILATTTIDPGQSYGGVIVGDRLKGGYPQIVAVKVTEAGVDHTFKFNVTEASK